MRKLFLSTSVALALLVALLVAAPASAQRHDGPRGPRANPEARIERHVERLDARLDLTDAQEAQLRTLLADQHTAAEARREAQSDLSHEERHALRQQQHEAMNAAVEALLTPAQRQTWDAMKTEWKDRAGERGERGRGRHRFGRDGGPHGGRLGEQLNLTDAQREQFQALHTEQREEAEAWREAHPNATREEKQAFREARRDAMKAAMNSLLTPEQQQRMEEMKSEGGKMHRGRRHHRGGRGLGAALDLTETQREQVSALRQAQREAARAWREANPEATREDKKAFHETQHAETQAAVEALLTPEQRQAYRSLQAERQARRQERGPRGKDRGGEAGAAQDAARNEARANDASAFALSNYPNPFNPTTEIRFTLPEASNVSLRVYDVQGREVADLLDGQLGAGSHAVSFDAAALPTGTYLYRLTVGAVTETGRMVLMK